MSIRITSFTQGEFYHVYNRGNSKQMIFHDNEDKDRFLSLLFISNIPERFHTQIIVNKIGSVYESKRETPLVAIGAHTLLPNHFHILLTPITENGVSKFMQKLSTAYAMYYNKKYKRTGGLFEGKFKSKHINTDNYLKYIFSYIHINIIKLIDPTWKEKGLRDISKAIIYLRNYKYSSYIDFLDNQNIGIKREESNILNLKYFPKYFANQKKFEKEIISWLKLKDLN